MEEQLIHKQKRRLFFGFLLAFALIFSLLGVLVFQAINFNLYASTDERLNEAVQSETTITREISFSNDSQNDLPEEMPNLGPSAQEKPADNQKPGDFQQIVILRTATGTILNEEALGVRYNELQQVQFDPQNLDEITSVTV
ncbi:hypothetical protein [Enterococcus timonensis]|uniref:hypothetical protein n=1 Tax=Enterococcus timonensis TaxID=1852364 RepID=UPI0009F4544D|nr:hypothetical protein [Enterococcus timonensis]